MESDIQDCPLLLLAQVMESMMARAENRIRETRGVGLNAKYKIPGLFVVSGFSVRNCKICWDSLLAVVFWHRYRFASLTLRSRSLAKMKEVRRSLVEDMT